MSALMLRRRAMKAPSSAFSPSDVPGLRLWLKADGVVWQDSARTVAAVADGDPVGGWDDASDLANHALQATASSKPSLRLNVVNAKPVVRFDGVDDLISGAAAVAFQHVFVVVRLGEANFSDYDGILTGTTNADGAIVLVGDAAHARFYDAATLTTVYHRDGTAQAETAMSAPMQVWGICSISLAAGWNLTPQIGFDRLNGGRLLLGDVAEVICYANVLSDADRRKVESHLGNKYAIAVA